MPRPLSPEDVAEQCDVSRETLDRLKRYVDLLEKWTKAINLVSAGSLSDVWRRHILDSAQLAGLLPGSDGRSVTLLDLGSGAGLPGLVLAILGVGPVHLVEADGRKATFLREAARATKAAVRVHETRVESLEPFPVDVVTARGLAPLDRLLDLAAPFLCPRCRRGVTPPGPVGLFLKGRNVEAELTTAQKNWNMTAECIASISDPRGVALRISGLSMKDEKA
jgi:16S rRNA (guanine527-N7)-methyltransferase